MLIEDGVYTRCDAEDIACGGVVVVPKGVKEIGKFVFQKRDDIKKVVLPEGIKKVGYFSFYECTGLEEINLPDSIEEIGAVAFSGCEKLAKIQLPKGLKKLGDSSFDCTAIERIEVPNVTYILEGTFADCKNLKEVILHDDIKVICFSAFVGCEKLKTIKFPKNVTEIEFDAFRDCSSLCEIVIPKGVKIGKNAFMNCPIKKINGVEGAHIEDYIK